jgi:molecular chaperone DnaK (HSP70)
MIELVAFIVFISLFILVCIDNVLLRNKTKRISMSLVQLYIEKNVLSEHLSQVLVENESKSVEQTDGFLKFVSQSRDWAYSYIEDAQDKIQKFDKVVDSVSGSTSKESLKRILEAYKELKTLLPDNQENIIVQGEPNE